MSKKKAKAKITKGEKLLYFMGISCLALTIILKVFCGAGVSHLSMSVEKMNYDITEQKKKNESLTMKVNELTSFDKVKDVVEDMGLAYNNENIIVVDK
jgi:cell division protein FtsL